MTDQHIPCFRSRLPFDYNIKKKHVQKKRIIKKVAYIFVYNFLKNQVFSYRRRIPKLISGIRFSDCFH